MKLLMKFFALVAAVLTLAAAVTSCDDLAKVEPDGWQRDQFERQVRKAVTRAVQSPGIDNGSTLVVSMNGDTLIAPADSLTRLHPARIVYVDIESPQYPKTYSSKAMAIVATFSVIGVVLLLIVIVMTGLFITSWRKQSGRNKIINNAIDGKYDLPEAFYTGSPSAAPVNVTQIYEESRRAVPVTPSAPADSNKSSVDPDVAPNVQPGQTPFGNGLGSALKGWRKASTPQREKQMQQGFILAGIGVMVFLGFISVDAAPVAFIGGGTLFVIGLSKLLSWYLNK